MNGEDIAIVCASLGEKDHSVGMRHAVMNVVKFEPTSVPVSSARIPFCEKDARR